MPQVFCVENHNGGQVCHGVNSVADTLRTLANHGITLTRVYGQFWELTPEGMEYLMATARDENAGKLGRGTTARRLKREEYHMPSRGHMR